MTETHRSPQTKTARQARIVDLLTTTPVRSQVELAEVLAADGFQVTQGTLSKDLMEVGAVRVRSPEGEVSLDFGGKKNGRGAYICPNPECLKKAIRSKALDRSLEVTIPEEVYQRLEKEMENG